MLQKALAAVTKMVLQPCKGRQCDLTEGAREFLVIIHYVQHFSSNVLRMKASPEPFKEKDKENKKCYHTAKKE